jgi:hypothetical protein
MWSQTYQHVVLPSAARTAAINSADFKNYGAKGLHLIIDITAITATPLVTVTIKGKDPVSGKYYTLLASTALAAVATTVLKVYPGLTAAANLVASDVLPRDWRVEVTVGDADSATYSIGAQLVP